MIEKNKAKPGPRPKLETGIYRHYKGKLYDVIDIACHTESLEYYVIYKVNYPVSGVDIWLRPYSMFTDYVTLDNKKVPRFKKIN